MFEDFLTVVKDKAYKADVMWNTTIKCFDYQPEVRKIEKFIGVYEDKSNEIVPEEEEPSLGSSLSDDHKKEIRLLLNAMECTFDLQTVTEFSEKVKKARSDDLRFINFLKHDKERVKQYYDVRFNGLINVARV